MARFSIFLSDMGAGGAQRVATNLSVAMGHPDHPTPLITLSAPDSNFYPLPPAVNRVALGVAGESRGLAKLTANWTRVRALRRVLREVRPDLVVAMMPTSTILAVLATRGLGIRVVGSERNFPGRRRLPRPWALARKLFYRFADGHVAQTREEAAWLTRHTGARNVTVIPNAVSWPLPAHAPRIDPASLIAPQRRLLLAVGTKPAQKGFDLLLPAFAALAGQHPDWDLAIVGVEPEQPEIARLVAEHDPGGRVILPGRVGSVGDWYARADLFVLSSRFEGFPNALLEAMAAGCACLSFDCDTGPRDIITPGEDGLLVTAEDAAALRDGLDRLMSNEALRAAFAARAVSVRARFSPERIYAQWLTYLESV